MNNSNNYPGWTNTPIKNDLGYTAQVVINTNLSDLTQRYILSNIAKGQYMVVNSSGVLYLNRNNFGTDYTQPYWQTNYPNLVFELAYPITNTEAQYEEAITQEEVINQLNAIYNAVSYDGQTNLVITSDPNNAQLLVEARALKEIV